MDGETTSRDLRNEDSAVGRTLGWLVMPLRDGGYRSFPIDQPKITIGRGIACDIRIAIPSIGKRHCEIAQAGALLTVRAIGDSPVLLEGRPITKAVLEAGNHLTIGKIDFEFRHSPAELRLPTEPLIVDVTSNGKLPGRTHSQISSQLSPPAGQ